MLRNAIFMSECLYKYDISFENILLEDRFCCLKYNDLDTWKTYIRKQRQCIEFPR